jgi:hypothetical protein
MGRSCLRRTSTRTRQRMRPNSLNTLRSAATFPAYRLRRAAPRLVQRRLPASPLYAWHSLAAFFAPHRADSAPRTALRCWTGTHPSSGVMAVSSFSSSASWCALAGAACDGSQPGSAAAPCTVPDWPASCAQLSVHPQTLQPHLRLRLHRA